MHSALRYQATAFKSESLTAIVQGADHLAWNQNNLAAELGAFNNVGDIDSNTLQLSTPKLPGYKDAVNLAHPFTCSHCGKQNKPSGDVSATPLSTIDSRSGASTCEVASKDSKPSREFVDTCIATTNRDDITDGPEMIDIEINTMAPANIISHVCQTDGVDCLEFGIGVAPVYSEKFAYTHSSIGISNACVATIPVSISDQGTMTDSFLEQNPEIEDDMKKAFPTSWLASILLTLGLDEDDIKSVLSTITEGPDELAKAVNKHFEQSNRYEFPRPESSDASVFTSLAEVVDASLSASPLVNDKGVYTPVPSTYSTSVATDQLDTYEFGVYVSPVTAEQNLYTDEISNPSSFDANVSTDTIDDGVMVRDAERPETPMTNDDISIYNSANTSIYSCSSQAELDNIVANYSNSPSLSRNLRNHYP